MAVPDAAIDGGARSGVLDAGPEDVHIKSPRTGLIAGSGGASTENTGLAADLLRSRGVKRVGATSRISHAVSGSSRIRRKLAMGLLKVIHRQLLASCVRPSSRHSSPDRKVRNRN